VLAGPDLDDIVDFYAALGFEVTFRQQRPNPYVCLKRGGLDLHFFGLAQLDPEASLGNVLVLVPDAGALFNEFAEGLRARYGRLPTAGIPRITRPRRKQGISGGFSVVDPGGNWLRVSSTSEQVQQAEDRELPLVVLERVMLNAARQGDARGDTAAAVAVLDTGLARHPDAPPAERVVALGYLAELLVRGGDASRARRARRAVVTAAHRRRAPGPGRTAERGHRAGRRPGPVFRSLSLSKGVLPGEGHQLTEQLLGVHGEAAGGEPGADVAAVAGEVVHPLRVADDVHGLGDVDDDDPFLGGQDVER